MDSRIERRHVELEIEMLRARMERHNPLLAAAAMNAEAGGDGSDAKVHYLYGAINSWGWGYGADLIELRSFLDENAGAKNDVLLRINSYGGQASAGVAMMNLIRDYPGKVTAQVDGVCASAATLPFIAAGTRLMGRGTELMIHNPSLLVVGDWEDMEKAQRYLRKLADMYAGLYADESDLDKKNAAQAMREETYYTADDAIEVGLATGLSAEKAPVKTDDDDDDDDAENPDIVVVPCGEASADEGKKGRSVIMQAEDDIREFELFRIRRNLNGDL